MPTVTIDALVEDAEAHEVFARIADFERYPSIAESVRAVRVEPVASNRVRSHWEVTFRNGILRWTEEDEIYADQAAIEFSQIAGDLAEFAGGWRVTPSDGAVAIRFSARFDLGIPSLAPMLDPVAEKALQDNVRELIAAFAADNGVRSWITPTSS